MTAGNTKTAASTGGSPLSGQNVPQPGALCKSFPFALFVPGGSQAEECHTTVPYCPQRLAVLLKGKLRI